MMVWVKHINLTGTKATAPLPEWAGLHSRSLCGLLFLPNEIDDFQHELITVLRVKVDDLASGRRVALSIMFTATEARIGISASARTRVSSALNKLDVTSSLPICRYTYIIHILGSLEQSFCTLG
jgi:hypothetical protein